MNPWLRLDAWRGLQGNLPKSMLLAFFQVFLVIIPIIVPYFQQHGLTMQQVFLTQAWFGAVVVLMEIPSGVLADRLGRKPSLVLGSLFLACGHLSLLWADSLTGFLIFEGLLGIGVSLISGADLALLYDTELALKPVDASLRAVANLYSMHSASEALAAIACSLLLLASMHVVIVIQVIAGCLPMFIAFTLVEPDTRPAGSMKPCVLPRFSGISWRMVRSCAGRCCRCPCGV